MSNFNITGVTGKIYIGLSLEKKTRNVSKACSYHFKNSNNYKNITTTNKKEFVRQVLLILHFKD